MNDEQNWHKLKIMKSDGTIEKSPLSEAEKKPRRHGDSLTLKCLHETKFFSN